MDLIDSKTEASRKLAMSALSGNVSRMISNLRNQMIEIITNIEVNIDYPEYEDILVVTTDMINSSITSLEEKLIKILKEAENGKIIKNGINTLIIGRPNVGKSSLLNKLLNEVFLLRKTFKYFAILVVKISVRKVLNTEIITFS